jgi:sec-independent protein translocase protein TatA
MFLREPSHWLIVVLALVLLFGWKRLPDMARSVGRSMRIFKSEVNEMKNDGKEGRPSPAADDVVPGTSSRPVRPTTAPRSERHSAQLSRRLGRSLVSAEPHPMARFRFLPHVTPKDTCPRGSLSGVAPTDGHPALAIVVGAVFGWTRWVAIYDASPAR